MSGAFLQLGGPAPSLPTEGEELLPARATAAGTLRRMLLSALVQFADRGYHAVSVRDIARGVGVRPSSMYEHTGSKEELLLDLMVIGHEDHREWLQRALGVAGDDPLAQMDRVMRAHVEFHATYPMLARVCNREIGSLSPAHLEKVMTIRNDSTGIILRVIEHGVHSGAFAVPDSYLAAAAIGAMGIRVAEWYTPESGIAVDDVADAYALFARRLVGAA